MYVPHKRGRTSRRRTTQAPPSPFLPERRQTSSPRHTPCPTHKINAGNATAHSRFTKKYPSHQTTGSILQTQQADLRDLRDLWKRKKKKKSNKKVGLDSATPLSTPCPSIRARRNTTDPVYQGLQPLHCPTAVLANQRYTSRRNRGGGGKPVRKIANRRPIL